MNLSGKSWIITNDVSAVNKLLRTKAKFENCCIANCKVQSPQQVAADLINAYSAFYEEGKPYKFISFNEQTMILAGELYDNEYAFLPESAKDLKTAEEILRVCDQIRSNDPTEEYAASGNKKLSEMKSLLSNHEKTLAENSCFDTVMVLRKAIEILTQIGQNPDSAAFLTELLPQSREAKVILCFSRDKKRLEQRFLDKLCEVISQEASEISLSDICAHEITPEYRFCKAYGITNEVEEVVRQIQEQHLRYGEVAIIYPEEAYENVLKASLGYAGIPYVFPRGFKACGTQYVQLLISMLEFAKEDFAYKSLQAICENPIVNLPEMKKSFRIILRENIGYRRERYLEFFDRFKTFDENDARKNENTVKFVAFLQKLIDAFDPAKSCQGVYNSLLSLAKAITTKTDVYKQQLSEPLKTQSKVFALVTRESMEEKIALIYDYLMQCKLSAAEDFGKVAIYPYGTVEVIDRANIFVLGLSNENIAATCAESPVFSDDELKRYAQGTIDFALEKNQRALNNFETTIALSSAKQIFLSYSYYDTGSLIGNSPSLLFLDRLSAQGLTDEKLPMIGYEVNPDKAVTLQIMTDTTDTATEVEADTEIDTETDIETDTATDTDKEAVAELRRFSASSVQTLLSCPLKFYYEKIRKVPQLDFRERRADQWLQGGAKGNVFHHVMEAYVNRVIIGEGKTTLDRAVLDTLFAEEMAAARTENPIPSEEIYQFEREECYDVLVRYIDELCEELNASDTGKKIIGCEVAFSDVAYAGGDAEAKTNFEIVFDGFIDRVDGFVDEDGVLQLEIIDYKTGSVKNKQKEIDDGTQIQHYVYALAMLDDVKKNHGLLEERLGCSIKGCCIVGMKYVFPYEEEQREIQIPELKGVSENIRMPIDDVLGPVVGLYQNGMPEQSYKCCKALSEQLKNNDQDHNQDHCKYCNFKNVCALV